MHTKTVYVHLPAPAPKFKEEVSLYAQPEYEDYEENHEEDYPNEWNFHELHNQQNNDYNEELSKPEPEPQKTLVHTKPWIYSNTFRHPSGGTEMGAKDQKNQNQENNQNQVPVVVKNQNQAPVSTKLQAEPPTNKPEMNQIMTVAPSVMPSKNETAAKDSRNMTDNQNAQTDYYGMGYYQHLKSTQNSYHHKKPKFGTRLFFVS